MKKSLFVLVLMAAPLAMLAQLEVKTRNQGL